ncbi:MAG: COX15/CtaA family protein, partial [Mariprofundaceae bacterium]|nr:COX15/CtaA family protein [Mariprofundaceae bacterium]
MNPRLIVATLVMCMVLIHASSIMHLTNAGMGSPDWPDSYGLITGGATTGMEAGKTHTAVSAITPSATIDRVHRVVANILQLLIIAVVFSAFLKRKSSDLRQPLLVPILALVLSLFLAFLGAWYGSPLRYPWIMIINLTGGIALLSLFWWLTLDIYA